MKDNPLSVSDWSECLQQMAQSTPESEPGQLQLYHYLSFGWLCGGIVEVLILSFTVILGIC